MAVSLPLKCPHWYCVLVMASNTSLTPPYIITSWNNPYTAGKTSIMGQGSGRDPRRCKKRAGVPPSGKNVEDLFWTKPCSILKVKTVNLYAQRQRDQHLGLYPDLCSKGAVESILSIELAHSFCVLVIVALFCGWSCKGMILGLDYCCKTVKGPVMEADTGKALWFWWIIWVGCSTKMLFFKPETNYECKYVLIYLWLKLNYWALKRTNGSRALFGCLFY